VYFSISSGGARQASRLSGSISVRIYFIRFMVLTMILNAGVEKFHGERIGPLLE
jgi:hypothetical protein